MAQAILLKDVDNLGEAGEAIDVSPGYLRNYLLPRKLAQPATDAIARGGAPPTGGRRARCARRPPSAPRRPPPCSPRPC